MILKKVWYNRRDTLICSVYAISYISRLFNDSKIGGENPFVSRVLNSMGNITHIQKLCVRDVYACVYVIVLISAVKIK